MYYLAQAVGHDIDMMNGSSGQQETRPQTEAQRQRDLPGTFEQAKAVDAALASLVGEFPMELDA